MLPVTFMQREKKIMKSGIACYYYIDSSLRAPPSPHNPLLSAAPGSLKALIYISLFNVSFLRGYYVNVPYISKSNTVFNLLYLYA